MSFLGQVQIFYDYSIVGGQNVLYEGSVTLTIMTSIPNAIANEVCPIERLGVEQ